MANNLNDADIRTIITDGKVLLTGATGVSQSPISVLSHLMRLTNVFTQPV